MNITYADRQEARGCLGAIAAVAFGFLFVVGITFCDFYYPKILSGVLLGLFGGVFAGILFYLSYIAFFAKVKD
jgi:nitrate/nitrite transporter NarK